MARSPTEQKTIPIRTINSLAKEYHAINAGRDVKFTIHLKAEATVRWESAFESEVYEVNCDDYPHDDRDLIDYANMNTKVILVCDQMTAAIKKCNEHIKKVAKQYNWHNDELSDMFINDGPYYKAWLKKKHNKGK
jgi:hypothetical protein